MPACIGRWRRLVCGELVTRAAVRTDVLGMVARLPAQMPSIILTLSAVRS